MAAVSFKSVFVTDFALLTIDIVNDIQNNSQNVVKNAEIIMGTL